MAKIRGKYPVRSIRISDVTFNKLKKKRKRGESWDKFLREHYVERERYGDADLGNKHFE